MLRTIIQQLAIFLLPFVLYAVYFLYARRRAQQTGQTRPTFEDGPWFWLIAAGIALSLAGFVALGFLEQTGLEKHYVPPTVDRK